MPSSTAEAATAMKCCADLGNAIKHCQGSYGMREHRGQASGDRNHGDPRDSRTELARKGREDQSFLLHTDLRTTPDDHRYTLYTQSKPWQARRHPNRVAAANTSTTPN